jgi:periplasmic protein TonB
VTTTFKSAFPYCLTASLALHSLLLLMWPNATARLPSPQSIPVSILESREVKPIEEPRQPKETRATRVPREAPTRPSRAQAIIAQKSSPLLEERPVGPKESLRQSKNSPADKPAPEEPRQEVAPVERQLPTLKELLPPVTWSASTRAGSANSGPVNLNTRDPQYITYFGSIKRSIELVWQYPELALRYGLQGRLLMQFAIRNNGELESAVVVQSSGSRVLDDEAMRAVKAAAPFSPIPPWIGKDRVEIVASFEYLDNRLNYRVMH